MSRIHNSFTKLNEKINSNDHVKSFFQNLKNYKFDLLENSIKITQDRIYADRYAIVQNKYENSKNDMLSVLSNITTNQKLIKKCIQQYSFCDRYGFAIEVGDKVNYRIYFETDMTEYRKHILSEQGKDRTITIVAYKWNSDQDDKFLTTEYTQLVDASKVNIRNELSELNLQYIPAYFDDYELLRFYVVKEDKSKRSSATIQLKNFKLESLREELTCINKDAKLYIEQYKKAFPCNISYGIDKNGNLFHTHYFILYNAVYSQKHFATRTQHKVT